MAGCKNDFICALVSLQEKKYRQSPLYGHLIITGILLCPWGKKALTFSLKSTPLIRTPHYYGDFALSLGKESPYFLSKFNRPPQCPH